MTGLSPEYEAYADLADISTRETSAGIDGCAFPVSLRWTVHDPFVCPLIVLGFPEGVARGALEHLADPSTILTHIGTADWVYSCEFDDDVPEEEQAERVRLAVVSDTRPYGARIRTLNAVLRMVATDVPGTDDTSWPTRFEFSKITLEFLVDQDLPLLARLARIGLFDLTTPEATSDEGCYTMLCNAAGDALEDMLHDLGLWDERFDTDADDEVRAGD